MKNRCLILITILVFVITAPSASAQLVCWDGGGGTFARIRDVDTSTGAIGIAPDFSGCTATDPATFFGGGAAGAGFHVGWAYKGSMLYGIEFDFDTGSYFLTTIAADGSGCARATRVSGEEGEEQPLQQMMQPGFIDSSTVKTGQQREAIFLRLKVR